MARDVHLEARRAGGAQQAQGIGAEGAATRLQVVQTLSEAEVTAQHRVLVGLKGHRRGPERP